MKIQARILAVKNNLIKAEVAQQRFKVGDKISIVKGSERTVSQNNFYWLYLTFVIDNGAKEHGHFDPYGLHLSLKRYFLSDKTMTKGQWKEVEEATTTDLSKSGFGEYFDKVDHLINETLGVDTSSFFQDYDQDWRVG